MASISHVRYTKSSFPGKYDVTYELLNRLEKPRDKVIDTNSGRNHENKNAIHDDHGNQSVAGLTHQIPSRSYQTTIFIFTPKD